MTSLKFFETLFIVFLLVSKHLQVFTYSQSLYLTIDIIACDVNKCLAEIIKLYFKKSAKIINAFYDLMVTLTGIYDCNCGNFREEKRTVLFCIDHFYPLSHNESFYD